MLTEQRKATVSQYLSRYTLTQVGLHEAAGGEWERTE